MKIIKQIGIFFTVCWLSQVVAAYLPFSFPSSVIGMILLFICLLAGVLKIEHIQEKADFLMEIITFAATAYSVQFVMKLMNRRKK